jgi:uncharacterized protein (DUF2062 family)
MRVNLETMKQKLTVWLRQGISPRRLALTLALGFTIGCVPVLGAPTLVCAALAVALGLNLPAIQAANYVAMPFQVVLIVPFLRLGGRLFAPAHTAPMTQAGLLHISPLLLHTAPRQLVEQLGSMAGQAMLGWFMVAVPAVLLISGMLTLMLRRIPALARESRG